MPTELAGVPIDWKSLFEKMSIGFSIQKLIWDENGNPSDIEYIDVNPSFERITGISREMAVGSRTSRVIPNLERIVYEHYGKVVKTGEPVSFEQFVADLGVYLKVYAFKTGENEFGAIFEDITQPRAILEGQLKEFDLMNTLIDSISDYVFCKNRDDVYVLCNKSFAENFAGMSKNELIGKTDADLFRQKDPEKLNFILNRDQEVYKSGAAVKVDWVTRLSNGQEVRLETIKTPLKNEKGEVMGIVGVSRDVTTAKLFEESLSAKMKELEFVNKIMVDRELKMVELKKTITELQNKVVNQ
jgi:PAS domain S-box-containing protein